MKEVYALEIHYFYPFEVTSKGLDNVNVAVGRERHRYVFGSLLLQTLAD